MIALIASKLLQLPVVFMEDTEIKTLIDHQESENEKVDYILDTGSGSLQSKSCALPFTPTCSKNHNFHSEDEDYPFVFTLDSSQFQYHFSNSFKVLAICYALYTSL